MSRPTARACRSRTNGVSFLPEGWDGNTMFWSGSDPWFDGSAGERIPANAWSHLAFSVNHGVVSVYINGEQRFSAGTLTDFFSTRLGVFALGVNYWDVPFDGMIDELKVYEASLSAAEIRGLDIDRLSDAQLLASAANILDLGDISAVRENLELPRTGPYASVDHLGVVASGGPQHDGQVTRPVPIRRMRMSR